MPFVDLGPAKEPLLPELRRAVERVLIRGDFVGGEEVERFEGALADYAGQTECITCSSGTTALLLGLMALGIVPGDEVIVPAYTFAAPVEAVLLLGAIPVLADIEPGTWTVCPRSVESLVSARTRAIIAVSLYGQPADFVALEDIARRHSLRLVEDAAQSFGAELHGRRSGSFGHLACTSFYPTKPLAGCGDGGAVLTGDPDLARVLRQVRNHGQGDKYQHVRLGLNGRLDTMACAMLLVKLAHFPAHLARRRELAARYDCLLAAVLPGDALPVIRPGASSARALYCLALEDRDAVARRLAEAGIATAVHYPLPLHRQPAYKARCRWESLPMSDRAARTGLCIPLYPGLSNAQQDRVIAALDEAERSLSTSSAGQSRQAGA